MAGPDVCSVNLKGLSKDEQTAIKKQIDAIVKRAQADPDITDIHEAVMASMDEYSKMLEVAAKQEKRIAYFNKVQVQKLLDHLEVWDEDSGEGLMSYFVGSQINKKGARSSVAVAIDTTKNRYKNQMMNLLIKEGVVSDFKSNLHTKDIYMAMPYIQKGQPVPANIDPVAVKIAQVIEKMNKLVLKEQNKYGAMTGALDGWVMSRHHDMFKIRDNMDKWKAWMAANVDWKRTMIGLDPDERVNILNEHANEFASGVHISYKEGEKPGNGLKGFGSVAKRMSKNRVYHFNSPEAEYEYAQLFGDDNLFSAFTSSLEQRGQQVGLLKSLGPNPRANLEAAVKKRLDKLSKSPKNNADKMERLNTISRKISENIMPVLTGEVSVPGSYLGATLESVALTAQRISALGGSGLTSIIGDSVVAAFNVARLEGDVSRVISGYGEMFAGLFRNLSDPEVQDLLADLSVTIDYQMATYNPRWSDHTAAITKAQRSTQAVENFFFYANGQYFVDTRNKTTVAVSLATRIGRNADVGFDSLRQGYKDLFNTHNIDAADWDLMRASLKDFKGINVLNIEGIKSLPNEKIAEYLKSKGIKDTRFQRERALDDLISRTRGMFQDQQGYSILAADARLRAYMFGGQKSGTALGFLRKSFWQFKQFPASFAQKMLGREIWSGKPMAAKMSNVAGILALTAIAGYVQMSVTDLRNGREPRLFTGDPEKDRALAAESVLRGGGLGIYGDFLYTFMQDKYGNSSLGKTMGPTYSDVEALISGLSQVTQGTLSGDIKQVQKGGDILAKVGVSNIPFANIPYIKPVLDYAILNQTKELISPGSLVRAEQRMKSERGQEYFMLKPSETNLWSQ